MIDENKLGFIPADEDTEEDMRGLVGAMKRLVASGNCDTLLANLPFLSDETDKWITFLIKLGERKAA